MNRISGTNFPATRIAKGTVFGIRPDNWFPTGYLTRNRLKLSSYPIFHWKTGNMQNRISGQADIWPNGYLISGLPPVVMYCPSLGCMACLTAYIIYFCTETHYEKCLKKVSRFVHEQNEQVSIANIR